MTHVYPQMLPKCTLIIKYKRWALVRKTTNLHPVLVHTAESMTVCFGLGLDNESFQIKITNAQRRIVNVRC